MLKELFIIVLFFGTLILTLQYLGKLDQLKKEKIVYKYIPLTTEELYENPEYVSDTFAKMFNNPTPWTDYFRL